MNNTTSTIAITDLHATAANREPNRFDLHHYDGRVNGNSFTAAVEFDMDDMKASVGVTFFGHSAVIGDQRKMKAAVTKAIKAKYANFK